MARQKFVLVAHTRTGSTHLKFLLDSHPEITCYGEILKANQRPSRITFRKIADMDPAFHDLKYRRDHYEAFLTDFFETSDDVLGFKLMAGQCIPALTYAIAEPSIKIIYLYRDNVLASYSSALTAKETGQSHLRTDEKQAQPKVVFSARQFQRQVNARREQHERCMELLQRSGKQFFGLEYNDLQQPQKLQAMLEFLGVTPEIDLESPTKKRNSSDVVSRFANPDDVMGYLQKNGHLDWAVEGNAD